MITASKGPIVFSVRHGESVGNVFQNSDEFNIYEHICDPSLWLSPLGCQQGELAGAFAADYVVRNIAPELLGKIRIIRSSLFRAVQSGDYIIKSLREALPNTEFSVLEDARLRERDFGYESYLKEPYEPHDNLSNLLYYQGYSYYSPHVGGESPADTEPRLRLLWDAIYRDMHENDIRVFFVVHHGGGCRVFNKIRYKYDNDWYEAERNPGNFSIRLMADKDEGYIFPNPNGQWDPNMAPRRSKAGDPTLNPQGKAISPEEKALLIEAQKSYPDILRDYLIAMKTSEVRGIQLIRSLMGVYT